MAKPKLIQDPVEMNEHHSWVELARKVLLASVGVVVLAQEEVEAFVDKLVERGQIAENEGRSLLKDVSEKRKNLPRSLEPDRRLDAMLKRMNVPSQSDIEVLSRKINNLSEKLDSLLSVEAGETKKE